ncbi:MAG: hypothetical protein CM15mP45_19100 [Deltaproteobacteria bacterium]|nr:MAG: hypothetical protein CM15mP45_19100 [Deltaproteobacteria bacterium]
MLKGTMDVPCYSELVERIGLGVKTQGNLSAKPFFTSPTRGKNTR